MNQDQKVNIPLTVTQQLLVKVINLENKIDILTKQIAALVAQLAEKK